MTISRVGFLSSLALLGLLAAIPHSAQAQDLYVANYATGANGTGSISKITSGGIVSTFATGLNNSSGLAFGPIGPSSAPEPSTLALLALGVVGGIVARRRW